MSRVKDLAFKGTEWLTNSRPLNIAFAGFLYSMVLLFLCAPAVGVWKMGNKYGQDVGYAQTLNWAIGFSLLVPLFTFFLLRTACEMDHVIKGLAAHNMLLDSSYSPHPRARQLTAARWTNVRRDHSMWWLLITIIGLVGSLGEWAACSMFPLFGFTEGPAEDEYDWSVRFMGGDVFEKSANAVFSLLVFLQQVWLISLIGFLIFFTLSFSAFITDLRAPDRAVRLFPSLRRCGKDSRLGYEQFADLFQFFLLSSLFLYTHLFFSRVWNAFLHPAEGEVRYHSVWEFIKGPLLAGTKDHDRVRELAPDGLVARLVEYLEKLGAFNFSGVAVSLGAFMVMLLSISLLVFAMRKSAGDARDELLGRKARKQDAICLENMSIWPLRYPGLTTLLAIGIIGALCMIVYRLGVYFLGMVLSAALIWGFSQLKGKKSQSA